MRRAAIGLVVVALGGAAVVAAAGVSGWRWSGGETTVVATVGTVSRVVVATGRVEPLVEVILANKIPGRIKTVLVKEGDPVRIGQPLIEFDDQEYVTQIRMVEARISTAQADIKRAQRTLEAARARWREAKSGARPQEIERARAELEQARQTATNAERDRARSAQLLDRGLIARSQYDSAATEAEVSRARQRVAEQALSLLLAGPKPEMVQTAWAQVHEAEAELRRVEAHAAQIVSELHHARAVLKTTIVESTIDGMVTRKLVEPGEAVDIGIPLMILANREKTLVKAEVDESDVGKLDVGQPVEVTSEAFPGRIFPGRVTEIGQAVGKRKVRPDDPAKIQDMKVLETKVEITEGQAALKLGMTVDVKIVASHRPDVLVIPRGAVPAAGTEATVQVVGPNGPEVRRISLGSRDEVRVEVLEGLSAGDRVVVSRATR